MLQKKKKLFLSRDDNVTWVKGELFSMSSYVLLEGELRASRVNNILPALSKHAYTMYMYMYTHPIAMHAGWTKE